MTKIEEIVVFITAGTDKEAKNIADKLLDQKKAACVNIVPNIDSFFWWQGRKEKAQESLLIVKSRASLLDGIIKLVKEAHSYEVPEIIAMPIIGGNQDYLDWIKESTAS